MSAISYTHLARYIRYCLIGAAAILVIWLILRDIVPFGRLAIESNFNRPDAFVTELVPTQRVQSAKEGMTVVKEPVYTTLRFPRPFRTLEVNIDFRNDERLLLEAGPQAEAFEQYDLQALDHPQLNKIFSQQQIWTGTEERSRLYQKRSAPYIYSSLSQFSSDLPDKQQSGYYGVSWPAPYIPDLKKRGLPNAVAYDIPLRGGHEFYVATAFDSLRFEMDVQDINNQAGPDEVTIRIFDWQGNVLAEQLLSDDGQVGQNDPTTSKRMVSAEIVGLTKPDVYRIQVMTTDDIIIHRVAASAPYLVVKGHVSLAGGPEYTAEFGENSSYPLRLTTSGRAWTAQTSHRTTLQTIALGEEAVKVEHPYEVYTYRLARGRSFMLDRGYDLALESGNIVLDGRGVFAFDAAAYFTPLPWLVDESVDIDVLSLNYVVTDYLPPVMNEQTGALTQTISIDLRQVFAPQKALRLQFTAPDMQPAQNFELLSMRLQYKTESLTLRNSWSKFKRFWQREILKR